MSKNVQNLLALNTYSMYFCNMKVKLICLLLIIFSVNGYSQGGWLRPNWFYGNIQNRISIDSSIFLPTGCGVPTSLQAYNLKKCAFYFDSCGHKGYFFDPSTNTWGVSGVIPTFQQTLQEGSILNQTNSINIYNPNNGLISPISLNVKLGKYSIFSISDSASGRNIYTAASFDYPSYQETSHYWVNPYGTGSLSAMSLIGTTSDNQFKVYNIDGTHYFGIYGSDESGINDSAASKRYVRSLLTTPLSQINSLISDSVYQASQISAINISLNGKEPAITAPFTTKKYYNGYKSFVNLNSDSLVEGAVNLFYTNARAIAAISPGRGWNYNSSTGIGSIDSTKPYQWNGSVTAASAIARGMYWTPTLTAAANNDTLVGAYFKPSYSLGSNTGVKKYAVGIYGGLYIKDSLDFDYNANNPLFYLNCNAVKLTGGTSPSFFQVQYLNTDIFSLNKNGGIITGLQATGTINAGAANGGTSASIQGTVGNTSSDALRTYSFSTANSPTTTLGASSLSTGAKGSAILNVIGWHGMLNTFTVSSPANASTLVSVDTFGNTGINGNLTLATAGNKLKIAAASNTITATTYAAGTVTLSGGTITVNTTAILTSSKVILTLQNCSNCGSIYLNGIVNTTSFTINSTNALDGSLVYWEIR